jgi:hypothetical protein
MIRLPLPRAAGLEATKSAFSEQELTAELLAAGETASLAASRLLAFARGDLRDAAAIRRAMLANPALRRLVRHMAESGAAYVMPEAIAASSTEFPTRRTEGCAVKVIASRAGAGAYYLVIELADPGKPAPKLLMLCEPEGQLEQIALPAPIDGVIQVGVDEASGIPPLLRNPKTAIFLR